MRDGDSRAFGRICDRYYKQLAVVASRKLGGARRVVDEFAVANEVLQEFYQRALGGDFENVTCRDDLLPLLVRLTHDKVVDEIRKLCAQKRGGGHIRGDSIFDGGNRALNGDFDQFRGSLETPSTRQIVADQIRIVLEHLPDEIMRAVFLLRAEGYTNEEIAKELQISLATVERKRRRIKDILHVLDPGNHA